MFLNQEELIKLTGYKQRASQIKWLREHGIRFLVGGDDQPKIMLTQVEELIGAAPKSKRKKVEPNFDALDAYMGI